MALIETLREYRHLAALSTLDLNAIIQKLKPALIGLFVPVFLSTGFFFGMAYVLTMKALRKDRKLVEAYFENLRHRLQAGPVPIIEKAQPIMLGGLYAVYGKGVVRRIAASLAIGLFTSCVVLGAIRWQCVHSSPETRQEKRRLEFNVDPFYYKYFTDPLLQADYQKSLKGHCLDRNCYHGEYDFKGYPYDQIRESSSKFDDAFVHALLSNPHRIQLMPLFLFEGNYVNRGFRFIDSLLLYIFNSFIDFMSVTTVIVALRVLNRPPGSFSHLKIMYSSIGAAAGVLVCALTAVISYRMFFGADTGFFVQLLLELPLSVLAAILGLIFCWGIVMSVIRPELREGNCVAIFYGPAGLIGGFFGLRSVVNTWLETSLRSMSFREALSFPYVLAGTTILPSVLALFALSVVVAAQLTSEPIRVLEETYMTFIKEEVGGTQAAGLIVIISAFVSAAVVWAGS